MSPSPTTTLDGEVSGPNYAATTPPPGLTENEVGQGGDNMINGAGPAPSSSTARTDDRTLPQPLGTSSVVEAADFLSTPATTKGPEANERAIPTAPASLSREAAPSSSGDQLHAGVFAFSPPEELPQEVRGSDVAGQSFWFARIGEFVQRRVAQAGAAMSPILESRSRGTLRQVVTSPPRAQRFFSPEAEQAMSQWTRRAPHLYTPEQRVQQQEGSSNGSLTQEQVMAEVQKQVKFEMRAHEAERYQLAEENNQLKTGTGSFAGPGSEPGKYRNERRRWNSTRTPGKRSPWWLRRQSWWTTSTSQRTWELSFCTETGLCSSRVPWGSSWVSFCRPTGIHSTWRKSTRSSCRARTVSAKACRT